MVPCDRILQTAIDEDADLIGLSGLITPSLDEMVFVAKEMERRSIRLPLLIGGATTSRQHTAVKIAPEYGQTTVHVLDASRVVDVVSSLLSDDRSAGASSRRTARAAASCGSSTARAASGRCCRTRRRWRTGSKIDWAAEPPAVRRSSAAACYDVPLDELVPFIDWTFFFAAWELKGRFPAILDHPQYGAAARDLYDNARDAARPDRRERLLTARGVYGFWPAASEGDDIVVYSDRAAHGELTRFNMLRQQEAVADGKPNLSLADFVADRTAASPTTSARSRSRPASAPTSWRAGSSAAHDDYSAIIVKALADRLAEAFAAYLHARRAHGVGLRRGARRRTTSSPSVTAGSARASAIRPVPTTARSSSCSTARRARQSASTLTEMPR